MRDDVTIAYRGATYEIGRASSFYGIWVAADPRPQPLEWWPATPEGWYAAWARFTTIEVPSSIAPVPAPSAPPGASESESPASPYTQSELEAQPDAHGSPPADMAPAESQAGEDPAPASGWAPDGGPGVPHVPLVTTDAGPSGAPVPLGRPIVAGALVLVGVVVGTFGLFSNYLYGSSLAQEADNLVPHVLYLAGWSVAGLLVILRPSHPRVGALLGAGISIITFGFLFADAGTAISGGAHLMGAGLVLSLVSWAICSTGSALACSIRQDRTRLARPRGPELVPFWTLTLVGVGAAAALAPAWDSYVLQDPAGLFRSLDLGNVFSNPAPVIAGNVIVMISLVALVATAALWRPARHGSALLAGAVIPMVAQAISAFIQLGETTPATLGISSAEATRLNLTITAGLTLSFWLYCAFLVALILMAASAVLAQRSATSGTSQVAVDPATGLAKAYETDAQSPHFPPGLSPLGPLPPGES